MAALWESAWLWMALLPALCSADQHLGRTAQDTDCPIVNLKLDPRRKTLTWNYTREVTGHRCSIDTPLDPPMSTTPQVTAGRAYSCVFPNARLRSGATLRVRGESQGRAFEEALAFRNAGREGSGAVRFACVIYEIRSMNCSWAPGPAAPADVQYRLFFWFSRDDDEAECARYTLDSAGLRVGCHFDDLGEAKRTDNYFFLLNGTSSQAEVQFSDFAPLVAFRIEKYDPPANVTVHYNRSSRSHVIRWDNPRRRFELSSSTFQYELDVQRTSGFPKRDPVFLQGQPENVYLLPSSDSNTENTVRMRVKYLRGEIWSEWSQTVHFGIPEEGYGSIPVTVAAVVVGVATLSTVVLMVLCRRYSPWQRLFPPIPQVKEEVTSVFLSHQDTWVEAHPPPDSQEAEEVLAVEETAP